MIIVLDESQHDISMQPLIVYDKNVEKYVKIVRNKPKTKTIFNPRGNKKSTKHTIRTINSVRKKG